MRVEAPRRSVATTVSVAELSHERNMQVPLTLVDVRTPEAYARRHVAGAINVPDSNPIGMVHRLKDRENVVLICEDGRVSALVARGLACARVSGTRCLEGGLRAWEEAGGATAERLESGSDRPIPRVRESATTRRLKIVGSSVTGMSVAAGLAGAAFIIFLVLIAI